MKMKLKGIRTKIIVIPVVLLLLMAVMYSFESYLNNKLMKDVQMPKFGEAVLNGNKSVLKECTDLQVSILYDAIKNAPDSKDEQKIIDKDIRRSEILL